MIRLNFYLFLIAFLSLPFGSIAQECNFSITGYIEDVHSAEGLEFTTIFIEENGKGVVTDDQGAFTFRNICRGEYHLKVSHIGCETRRIFIQIKSDTSIVVRLHHHSELLQEILVQDEASDRSKTGTRNTIDNKNIVENADKNLAELVTTVTGVTSLKNGSNISKPIIHGLKGNRVAVLNNGELQAGQQWGNDHAPEIDPFSADKITVIKGAEGVRYGGNAIGGIILIEPGPIPYDPHIHGLAQYLFNTNGRSHGANFSLNKGQEFFQWRLKAGYSKGGDLKTPDYFLNNTGKENAHASVQLNRTKDQWSHQAYYSFYSTDLGVLRGAHIGNTTDLESAISRDQPFYTEENFSYGLEAPRQFVQHHLWKIKSKYFFSDHNFMQLSYAGQSNQRKEFDVRRSGRSDIPALSLGLLAHNFQLIYHKETKKDWHLESGLQFRINDNENNFNTGIFPLIPNYESYQPSVFFSSKKSGAHFAFDFGARYDYKLLTIQRFTKTTPPVLEKPKHNFHNYTFLAGVGSSNLKNGSTRLQVGVVQRSPEINELYSEGLHQGVASIEEGDRTLNPETGIKILWTSDINIQNKLFFEVSFFTNPIRDFIFLELQDKPRLTIRGAFPLYFYKQANANLSGVDFLNKWVINSQLTWINKFAYVRGQNIETKTPLIDIPSGEFQSTFRFEKERIKRLQNFRAEITGSYVLQQNRFPIVPFFPDPPPGYFLLNLNLGVVVPIGENRLSILLSGENLLNQKYRSFLNRLRYFADEQGLNLGLNLRYKF